MEIGPQIIKRLLDEESRLAERRISVIRLSLLAIGLCVLMPIKVLIYGLSGDGLVVLEFAVLAVGVILAGLIAWGLRRNASWRRLAGLGLLVDFGVLGALIAEQAHVGYVPEVGLSVENYKLLLPIAYIMNVLSGLRLSRRLALLSGLGCLGLVVEARVLDLVVNHSPTYLFTDVLLSAMAIATTGAAFFVIAKTKSLLLRASHMETEALRVRDVLSRYVSETVADEVLEHGLGYGAGQRRRVSILFSDIRGFTRMSEGMPPEEVVALLNAYFSRMVQAVHAHDGMLDKYIGDGMMVVFGAPIVREDHALQAVQAALRMRSELVALNAELVPMGYAPLQIGIGIHTGECVIGSIGCEQRLDYTAIGDTVNTASRIESLTKDHGVDILISAETYADLMGEVAVRPLPGVAIRGKTATLDLFIVEDAIRKVPQATTRRNTNFLW